MSEEEKVVPGNRGSHSMRPIPKSDPSASEYKMTGWSSRKDTTLCGTLSGWRMSSRNDKESDIVGCQVVDVSVCQP